MLLKKGNTYKQRLENKRTQALTEYEQEVTFQPKINKNSTVLAARHHFSTVQQPENGSKERSDSSKSARKSYTTDPEATLSARESETFTFRPKLISKRTEKLRKREEPTIAPRVVTVKGVASYMQRNREVKDENLLRERKAEMIQRYLLQKRAEKE